MVVNRVAIKDVGVQADRHYKCDTSMPYEAYNVVANPKVHTIVFSVIAAVFAVIFAAVLLLVLIYDTGSDTTSIIAAVLVVLMMTGGLLGSVYALVRILRNHKNLIIRLDELGDTLKNGLIAIPTILSIKQARESSGGKSGYIKVVIRYSYLGAEGNTIFGEVTFTESIKIKELNPVVIAFCNDRTFMLKNFTLLDQSIEIKKSDAATKAQEVRKFFRLDDTSYSENVCPSVPASSFYRVKGLLISGLAIMAVFTFVALVSVYVPVNPSVKGAVITFLLGVALCSTPLGFAIYRLVRNIKLRKKFALAQRNGYLAIVSATSTDNEHVNDFGEEAYRVKVTCLFRDLEDEFREFEFWVDSPDKKTVADFGEIGLLVNDDSIFYLTSYSAKFPLKKSERVA